MKYFVESHSLVLTDSEWLDSIDRYHRIRPWNTDGSVDVRGIIQDEMDHGADLLDSSTECDSIDHALELFGKSCNEYLNGSIYWCELVQEGPSGSQKLIALPVGPIIAEAEKDINSRFGWDGRKAYRK